MYQTDVIDVLHSINNKLLCLLELEKTQIARWEQARKEDLEREQQKYEEAKRYVIERDKAHIDGRESLKTFFETFGVQANG